jgi:hypothetical protein
MPPPLSTEDRLARFLLGIGEPPEAEVLRAARLAAYAYSVLAPDHPSRAALRSDYLAALARHHRLKGELVPLLTAWREAGIEALLFKGFYLAEFIYPLPGARFHGDVDLVLREADLREAARVASALGWRGVPAPGDGAPRSRHGVYDLWRPGGATQVDVQRFVVHGVPLAARASRRLTEAVWAASVEREWEGTVVRVPSYLDAALVCLILHRSWDVAPWRLKPHDVVDLRLLSAQGALTREAVRARARELGYERTLGVFLERCDPWAGRLELGRPSVPKRVRLLLRCAPERMAPFLIRPAKRILRLPAVAVEAVRLLPTVVRVRRALRREPDLRRLLASLTPPPPPASGTLRRQRLTLSAAHRLLHLVPRGGAGPCVVRSLILYHALRRQGWPVTFVSGVRRENGGVVGHAWIEYDGKPLPQPADPEFLSRYSINFRY